MTVKSTELIDILQNCKMWNDGVYSLTRLLVDDTLIFTDRSHTDLFFNVTALVYNI